MRRFGFAVLSALFMLVLASCGSKPSNLSEAPANYVNRYPGEYNTKLANYDDIHVQDNDGNDISPIAIDLWYAANEIYDVDDTKMFEIGAYEVSLPEYAIPQSNELLDYYSVVENVFTQNGISQLEKAMIEGQYPLIRKKDGKVYRMGSWKTGCSFARALTDMEVKELSEDKITLTVTYAIVDNDDTILELVSIDFIVANVDGNWLVDDYVYPEVYRE